MADDMKQAAIKELARRELARRAETAPKEIIQETQKKPMFSASDYNLTDIYATPKGLSPLQQAMQTATRGVSSGLGGIVPGGEITVRKPELAGRTAGAILAPVGSLAGLGGEFLGRELAPEGKEDIGQAIGGLAGGVLGESAVAGAKKLTSKVAGNIINSMIKPKQSAFQYGKNPGKTVADLGITGNSLEDLGENIGKVMQSKMDELTSVLTSPKNIKTKVDYANAINVVEDAISNLKKAPRTNASIIGKVQDFRDDLLSLTRGKAGKFKSTLTSLTPEEALEMKRVTGNAAKWTGSDTPAEFQGLVHKVYHEMRKAMERAVPETAKINNDIANLIGASRAIPGAVARGSKLMLPLSAKTVFSGLGGGLLTGGSPIGAAVGMGVEKALSSPVTGTRIAKQLAKFSGNKGKFLTALMGK